MESYSVEAVLKAVDSGFSSTFKNASDTAQNTSKKVSSALSSVGKGTMAVGALITAFGAKSLQSYGEFSSAINKAAVIGGNGTKGLSKNMKTLTNTAIGLGKELPISTQEAANAMVEMARQGATVGDIKKEFPPIARAAASAGEDLTGVATTVQSAMNIWGGGMKKAAIDSATMAIVANKSSASIGDMQQVFANMGPAAKNLGFSLKDVSVAAGIMSNTSLGAAQGSMDLNHALTQMYKPSKNAKAMMEKLGISVTDSQGNFKPFRTILGDTAKATNGLSKSQRLAALSTMFGTAGAKAMIPLLDSVTDGAHSAGKGWDDMSGAVDKGAGSYKKASKYLKDNAQNMTNNVGDAIDQMKDSWSGLNTVIMGESSPAIQSLAKWFANLADSIGKMHGPLGDLIKGFVAFAPIIGPAVIAIGAFITGAGKIVGVLGGAGKLLGSFTNKTKGAGGASAASAGQIAAMGVKAAGIGVGIGAAAAGIGVFAMGVAKMASTGKSGLIALAALTASIVVLAGTFALLKGPLTAAIPAMLALSATMLAAGASALMIGGAVALAGEGINLAGAGVMKLVQAFVLLSQNMTAIVPTMTAVGTGFAMMITSFITTLATQIPQVSLAIVNMMLNILQTINTYMPQLMQQGVLLIVNFLNGLATGMPQIILAATNLIVNFLNALTVAIPRIAEAGVNLIVALVGAISDGVPRITAAGIALIGSLAKSFVEQLPLLVTIMGATMAAVIAVAVTYVGAFRSIGGVLMGALKAGLTGKKFDVVGESAKIINSAGTTAASNGKKAFDAAGGNSAISAANAISNKKGNAQQAGSSLASSGANGVKGKQGQFKSAGSGNGSAAASGIGSKSGAASKAGSSLGKSGASGARGAHGSFRSAGGFLGQGLVNGIGSMAGAAMKAAASIASKAAGAIKKALDINSPSRVTFGFGSYFGEGFVNGIDSMQKNAARVAGNMSAMASNALNDNIQGLNSRVNGSYSGSLTMQDSSLQMQNNALLRTIAGKSNDIYLDGDTLVGGTADRMDNRLGNNTRLGARFS